MQCPGLRGSPLLPTAWHGMKTYYCTINRCELLVKAVLPLVLYCIVLTKTFQLLHLPYLYFGKVEMESSSLHLSIPAFLSRSHAPSFLPHLSLAKNDSKIKPSVVSRERSLSLPLLGDSRQ